MILFWLFTAAMITAALAFVLPPLVGRKPNVVRSADVLNRDLHRRRLDELDTDLANAMITEDDHREARRELERAAFNDLQSNGVEAQSGVELNPLASAAVALFVPVLAFGMYLNLGALDGIEAVTSSKADTPAASVAGMPHSAEEMIAALEVRLASQPEDRDGWQMLARSYIAVEQPDAARAAFDRGLQAHPDDPLLLTDYAEFLARMSGGDLGGEPAALVNRALKKTPEDPKALLLAGLAAFQGGDPVATIDLLERFRRHGQPEGEVAQVTADIIARAKIAMGETPVEPQERAPSATGAAQLVVNVSLADDFLERVAPDDVVFIFARASLGPRMPLAVVRKQVRDLPITVTLTDAMAMTPAFKLSGFDKVVAGARVSKTGDAISKSGDLQGLSGDLEISKTRNIDVSIDEVIP